MVDAVLQRSSKLVIEVCVDSVESAVAAVRGGADRLELCGNLGYGGGTTPSIGLLRSVQQVVHNIPIMAMVRPRIGDFVYSEEEVDVMLQDISVFKESGVQGVVFGALTPTGDVDEKLVEKLVSAAAPLEGPEECLEIIVRDNWDHQNINKVNTLSGRCKDVNSPDALEVLVWMLNVARVSSTKILPGSGINSSTVPVLCKALLPYGLDQIHLSGGRWVDGHSAHRPDGMGMGEWSIWKTDEEAIRKVRYFVDEFCAMKHSEQ